MKHCLQERWIQDHNTKKEVNGFFSDIKNFTSTSENMQPEDLTKYLNEYCCSAV